MARRKARPIQASEISAYLYCARAWWYRRRGEAPRNAAQLEAGRQAHRAHGRRVARVRLARWGAYVLLALAVVGWAVYWALQVAG